MLKLLLKLYYVNNTEYLERTDYLKMYSFFYISSIAVPKLGANNGKQFAG